MRENGLDREREKTLRRFTALNEILRFHSFLPIYFEGGIEGVFRDFNFARTYGSGQKRDLSGFFLSGPFNGSRGRGALTSHSQRKGVISSFLKRVEKSALFGPIRKRGDVVRRSDYAINPPFFCTYG